MAANVETMFYAGRTAPWHGLGVSVEEAPTSKEAIYRAGLDWQVIQKDLLTEELRPVPGFKVNLREDDGSVLGVVTNRYRIIQNEDAFGFTDSLLGHGVTYETAGSLNQGRRIWLLAKLPEKYLLAEETAEPYLVFSNSHDGTGAVKVAMTPIRVVCQNTLNLALNNAKRVWSTVHTGDIQMKLDEARSTLLMADRYMVALQREAERLSMERISDAQALRLIDALLPMPIAPTEIQQSNVNRQRASLKYRYFDAPDLKLLPKNGWRFINAVSDFSTHGDPLRKTKNYRANLFEKTIDGHPLIDRATQMIQCAA